MDLSREEQIFKILIACVVFGFLLVGSSITYLIVDIVYIKPIADNAANVYCQSHGFDQYKAFSRVGFWSKVPVGIKCEFAEKYTDLGVRNN